MATSTGGRDNRNWTVALIHSSALRLKLVHNCQTGAGGWGERAHGAAWSCDCVCLFRSNPSLVSFAALQGGGCKST